MKKNAKIETWVNIPFTTYQVSDLGKIKSLYKNGKSLILSPSTNGQGERDYQFVIIEGKKYYVHQLVLECFVGKRPAEHDCNHISGDRTDNRLVNLEYLHRSINRSHRGQAHGKAKLSDKLVRAIRKLKDMGVSQRQIAELYEVSVSCISNIITGKTWSHIS